MSLLDMPLWVQVAVAAEALALGVLTARFGWRGLSAGLVASVLFWFVLGFLASWLVSRLEGRGPGAAADFLPGAVLATLRLAQLAAPLVVAAAAVGGLVRWGLRRHKPRRG